ncbi:unnamed protein product [marine sediment metagenome]|uniref:Uncharacterized protein n=1 Tax=marine sediment metagenome TaxID=412755 RepID=X1LXP9_9ZZZZ
MVKINPKSIKELKHQARDFYMGLLKPQLLKLDELSGLIETEMK